MENGHNQVPDLGALKQKPTHAKWTGSVLPRYVNEDGGTPLDDGRLTRSMYLDASDLLKEIREIVREEIRAAIKGEAE